MTATDESTAMADAIRAQLALAIEPQEFDSDEYRRDPFPLYKRLRDHHPIYQDLFHKRWVVSRYDDIVEIFQNNDDFNRAVYDPKGEYEFGKNQVFGPNILEYGNSDEHRFLRNVVADQFVGNRLQGFLPFIEQIARELMGQIWAKSADDVAKGFAGTGEVELVSEFTSQFPIRVISNMLGLPREDENTFVRWYQHLIEGLGFGGEHFARGMQARNEMWDYLDPLIRKAEDAPGEDLISRIVHAEFRGQRMNVDEIKGFIALLLAAGGDTTDKAIANMWYHMLYTRPDQFENEVQRDPSLWTNVFTEMMRYDPVVHGQGRHTTRTRSRSWARSSPSGRWSRCSWGRGTGTSASSRTRTRSTSCGTTCTWVASCAPVATPTASTGISASAWGSTSAWATRWRVRRRSLRAPASRRQ